MSRKKIILIHVLIWLVVFTRGRIVSLTSKGLEIKLSGLHINKGFALALGYMSITMFVIYASCYVVKKILWHRKLIPALLYVFLLLIAIVCYRAVLEFWVFKPLLGFDNYAHNTSLPLWKYFIPNVVFYYWDCVIYGLALAFFMHWQAMEKAKREKETLDKTLQLQFLQSQINPHFLFNTINDIYALALKKSDKTPEALMQLSGLLRYALYDNKELLVPLTNELTYINDYLNLQRTGYENIFYVEITIAGNAADWQVPPMLLLPFVENACKHGTTNDQNNPVLINISVEEEKLIFIVSNQTRVAQKDAVGGIGIGNIRKRLELLYPAKHLLQIQEDRNTFIVQLEIEK